MMEREREREMCLKSVRHLGLGVWWVKERDTCEGGEEGGGGR